MTAARMVRSLTDTRPQTLVMPLPQPSAVGRPRVPRPPRREGRCWAVPLAAIAIVVLVAIVVAALLPAQLVASKDVERDGEAVSEETPYAVVPASVQPVADRVSYADLGADVAVDTDPDGRVFFVTVSRTGAVGARLARRRGPAGRALHDRRGEVRHADAVAAAHDRPADDAHVQPGRPVRRPHSCAGYDPELVPGPVQIEQMLCLDIEGNAVPSTSPAPTNSRSATRSSPSTARRSTRSTT